MANYAESKIFELILEGNEAEAEKIVNDLFPGEVKQIRNVLEKLEEMLDDFEESVKQNDFNLD